MCTDAHVQGVEIVLHDLHVLHLGGIQGSDLICHDCGCPSSHTQCRWQSRPAPGRLGSSAPWTSGRRRRSPALTLSKALKGEKKNSVFNTLCTLCQLTVCVKKTLNVSNHFSIDPQPILRHPLLFFEPTSTLKHGSENITVLPQVGKNRLI